MTDTISSDDGAQWPVVEEPRHGGMLGRLSGASRTTAMTAAVSAVLLGGIATVTVRSFAPTANPAEVVPASAFAIAQFDLSLPDGQADATEHLVKRFPGAPTGSGSIRDRLLRAMFKDSSDPHVDYDRSIKPWLGDHVAVAGWIDGTGKPQAEFVLESTDDGAARTAIHKASPDVGIAFSHGFAVLAPSQSAADAAVRAADKSSLADNTTYTGDLGLLDGTPVATGWADGAGVAKAIKSAFTSDVGAGAPDPLAATGLENVNGRVVTGLRVSDDGDNSAIQLDIVARGGPASKRATSTDRLVHLPRSRSPIRPASCAMPPTRSKVR
jgi:hypothetical protein